jgi:lipopolysaccharide/colanic/teichoic acid biosynthesis glycosyltransferase
MLKEVDKFESKYRKLFTSVKPGATGLAQLNQLTNPELHFEEEIKLDMFYIENWSLWLDIYIIFKTVILIFAKRPREDY